MTSWIKRIGIVFGTLLVVAGIGYAALKYYAETYSFAPQSPEQAGFANEHARCVGFYMVLRSSLKKEKPNYSELESEYSKELEHHAKMGFNFSPDKDKFKSQIEIAAAEFKSQIINAANNNSVAATVDARMNECFGTVFKSGDFVKRTLQQRADR